MLTIYIVPPSLRRWRSGETGGPSMAHDSMCGRILAVLLLLLLLPGGEVGGEAPFAGIAAELPTLAVLLPLALPGGATRAERSVSRALPSAAGATMSSCAEAVGATEASLSSAGGIPAPPPGSSEFQPLTLEPKSS